SVLDEEGAGDRALGTLRLELTADAANVGYAAGLLQAVLNCGVHGRDIRRVERLAVGAVAGFGLAREGEREGGGSDGSEGEGLELHDDDLTRVGGRASAPGVENGTNDGSSGKTPL